MMKKIVLTAFVASTIATAAMAQGISIGPRFGVTSTNVSASSGESADRNNFNDNVKYKIGVFGGVALNAALTENFSIQPELLYMTQGYQYEFEADANNSVKDKFTTSYLKLPVLLKATFGTGDLKYFVNAGPYVSYWMTGEQDYKVITDGQPNELLSYKESIKFKDDDEGNGYNRLDAGVAAGVGVGYMAGPGMLTLDFRYDYGLSDMYKYKNDRPSTESKFSNRVFSLGVGYMFGMGN